MKLNISETKVTSSRKTNILICKYTLCQYSITRIYCTIDLEVCLDSKFNFHTHVKYIYIYIKLLGLVRCVTLFFSVL
jgi:hypothetical protein